MRESAGAVKSYCSRLVSTAMWGGQPEVQALCAVLRHPITVFQAESAPLHAGTEFEPAAPLTISFHQRYYVLGDHYNSVVPKAGT